METITFGELMNSNTDLFVFSVGMLLQLEVVGYSSQLSSPSQPEL